MAVRRVVTAAAVALAVTALTACGSSSDSSAGPVPSTATASTTTATPSTSPGSPEPSQTGSPSDPVLVQADDDPLAWRDVPGSTQNLVTLGGRWTLTVSPDRSRARLAGPHPRTFEAGPHSSISDALLDGAHALVVSEDRLASAPDRATLVDLANGKVTPLDRASTPRTVVGGTWALGPTTLAHATSGTRHRYCLAAVDLASGKGTTGWCAQPRHGFSRAAITPEGETMMTFDAQHPSCRTLVAVDGAQLTALPGLTPCLGWDAALLTDGAVWSVVPKQRRIEAAHFYAHTSTGWYDLGPGTSGSLVPCAGAAYFVRDPQQRTDPATLLRWSPDDATLSTVFASDGHGNAFLSPPRCGGDHLTLTAFASAGDQQVTAPVG